MTSLKDFLKRMMTVTLKDLTLKDGNHWVVNRGFPTRMVYLKHDI